MHLLCRPMPRASCRSAFEGHPAHVCSLHNAKKKTRLLPPLSLRRAYRVIDRYAERTQFLIKSWVYGRGLKVFIYVYLPLHAPWARYLARSKYMLMRRLIHASGFSTDLLDGRFRGQVQIPIHRNSSLRGCASCSTMKTDLRIFLSSV